MLSIQTLQFFSCRIQVKLCHVLIKTLNSYWIKVQENSKQQQKTHVTFVPYFHFQIILPN